jgi:hypothetical protein
MADRFGVLRFQPPQNGDQRKVGQIIPQHRSTSSPVVNGKHPIEPVADRR